MASSLQAMAAAVRQGRLSARTLVADALARIGDHDGAIRAFTRLVAERALAAAEAVDRKVAQGLDPGVLAGVPFAVKDLFDVAGLPNTAGARMRLSAPAAAADAEAVSRLEAAGAVLVGTLNMDAFAYGFVTDNAHYGITRNPRDPERFAGGSSGGSAAAVAAGMVPLTLGSDTNGSIRVPAALCGIYGLKPTHGGLPMDGVFPFVDSLDDIGPFASSLADLKLSFEVLRGAALPAVSSSGLRAARLTGWFAQDLHADMAAGLDGIDAVLGPLERIDLPEAARARSAAFLMTAAEGGAFHRAALGASALDYDPGVRDRLLAGAMLPTSVYLDVQRFRAWFVRRLEQVFGRYDVLIAPSVAGPAPRIGDPVVQLDGQPAPARKHLGKLTQPISFAGLPVVAVPLHRQGLPLGLQLIGPPGGEARLFAFAEILESEGLIGTTEATDGV